MSRLPGGAAGSVPVPQPQPTFPKHAWGQTLPGGSGRGDRAPSCSVGVSGATPSPCRSPPPLGRHRAGLRRSLAVPLSPSLPPRCLGGSGLMQPGHLLQGSPPAPGHAARQTPLRLRRVLRITSAVSSRDICRRPPVPPPLQAAGHRRHLLPDVSRQPRRGTGWAAWGGTCAWGEGRPSPPPASAGARTLMAGPGALLPASWYPAWAPGELLAHLVLLFPASHKHMP